MRKYLSRSVGIVSCFTSNKLRLFQMRRFEQIVAGTNALEQREAAEKHLNFHSWQTLKYMLLYLCTRPIRGNLKGGLAEERVKTREVVLCQCIYFVDPRLRPKRGLRGLASCLPCNKRQPQPSSLDHRPPVDPTVSCLLSPLFVLSFCYSTLFYRFSKSFSDFDSSASANYWLVFFAHT